MRVRQHFNAGYQKQTLFSFYAVEATLFMVRNRNGWSQVPERVKLELRVRFIS